MNRFEQAVYDCMKPTEALYERTTDPFHRKILLNFWRHVHLEGAGLYDEIACDDMMVADPVYRITWGANPAVVNGREGVKAFYNSVGDAVLWNSDDLIAVADWGIADELTFNILAPGFVLQSLGYDVPNAEKHYHVASRQAFIWPYDEKRASRGKISTRTRRACAGPKWTNASSSRRHASRKSRGSYWKRSMPASASGSGFTSPKPRLPDRRSPIGHHCVLIW